MAQVFRQVPAPQRLGFRAALVGATGPRALAVANEAWWAPGAGSYTLTAVAGSFALTGNAAGLRAGRKVVAAPAALAFTGRAAGLRVARRLVSAAGAYVLTGNATGLARGKRLGADAGVFSLSGPAVGLRVARRLVGAAGAYALTAPDGGLSRGRRLTADPAGFVLSAPAAGLRVGRRLVAGARAFAWTGYAAGLVVDGAAPGPVVWRVALGAASGGTVEVYGMAQRADWAFDAGEDWAIRVFCRQADAVTPVDLSGADVVLRVGRDGAVLAEASGDVIDGPGGEVLLTVPAADTADLTPDTAATYTVRATLAGGQVTDQLFGYMQIRATEFELS